MPPPNEPAFVTDLLENERFAAGFIFNWQNRVVEDNWSVQNLTRRQAMSRVPREVKDRLKTVNSQHLERMRTGYFDRIFLEGAKSVDDTFFMTPADRRKVQAMSVDYYTKMRNARAFATRDSERFVSHVWEDTKDRRKMFNRNTKYLDRYGFQGRPGALNFIEDPAGVERMDKRFGVKAAIGADGRKWSYTKYARMQGDAFGNKLYNEGALAGAERQRLKGRNVVVVVSDGPDCGWTYHEDPQKADGMVVSIEEAHANPIAHPYCQRRFSISTKPKDREKVTKRAALGKAAAKVAAGAAVTGLSAYAASAASNIAASAFARFAASDLFEGYINHLRQLMFNGDAAAQHFLRAAVALQDRMINWDPVIAASRQTNAQLFPFTHARNAMWPGGPLVSEIPEVFQGVRAVGDEFLAAARHLPQEIRKAEDNVLRFLNRAWPVRRTEEQMQLAFEGMQKFVRSKENRQNLVSVVNAEFQRRNVLHRLLLRLPGGEAMASKVTLTWSQWGQRLRVDPFDWLRGHITFTPTGLIRSLSFFPKTAFRGVVKMYQDGSIGGHLSALPKNFMNGVFRAIVEVDEHGALVGNIRIVPKGPLRVSLEFITKQPKEVAEQIGEDFVTYLKVIRSQGGTISKLNVDQIAEHLVFFMQNHASPLGFYPRDLAQAIVRRAREAEMISGPMVDDLKDAILARGMKLTFDPRDIVTASRQFGAARVARDLGYAVRQFRFHRAVVEWRIFNKSVFDIHANLRIPLDLVKATVERLKLEHALAVGADGRLTGTFKFILHSPEELFKTVRFTSRALQEETGVGLRATLFGNIRFSGLKATENNPFLRALKTGKVRFLSRIHFDQDGLAEIATNMRIFGWNIYDIANVLKVRVADIKAAINEGFSRTHLMAYRLGFTKLDDAIPLWDEKMETVRQMFGTNEAPVGRAESLLRVTKAMTAEFTNPIDERALKFLAGIRPSDSPTQIRLKLLHLRNWINTVESRPGIVYRDWEARGVFNPFTGFPPDVDANTLKLLYLQTGELAKGIDFKTIAAKSDEIYKSQRVFRLKPNLTYHQAVEKIDYAFGRFQAFFLTKGWAQDHILRAWDSLVTHFDLATRRFIPNSWSDHVLTPDQLRIIDNWRNYAVPEGNKAFTVGDVRFSIDDNAVGNVNLLEWVDENYVKEVLKDSAYLRRRFPNVDLPEHRLVLNYDGPGSTYYEDGIIHWAYQWGENFKGANKTVMNIHHNDQVSGHQLLFRRRNAENNFRRVYFHEYGHYLQDHLSNNEVDELLDIIDREFGLHTLLHDPVGMEISLNRIAQQGFNPRDIMGNAFAAWERQAKMRRSFADESSIESLRFTQRYLGKYATMNPDELVAEAMSHYLNFRDPSRAARAIGEFMDEKIVGNQGRLLAEQVRPRVIGGTPAPSLNLENIEDVFQVEVPQRATIRFLRKADKIAKASTPTTADDIVEETETVLMKFFHDRPGVDNLDDAVRWYWTEDFDHVKGVRAAWQELNGFTSPVSYTDRDIVAALRLQKMWDEFSTASEKKLYRGLQATEKGTPNISPEAMAHVEKLLTEGEQFRLPVSSFTDKLDVAMTHATWDASNPGILIEVEQGARSVPLFQNRTVAISQSEILSQGVFEVVRVERNWRPTEGNFRVMIKQNLSEGASQQSVEQWMDIFRRQASGDITRVVLRRIAD